jgi:hypothetical protein
LSTYDIEFLVILVTVEQWRSYLQHAKFVNHRSLMHITEQRLHTPWQLKMHTKMAGLQYKVIYKPGSSNSTADSLSHHPKPPAQLQAILVSTPNWLSEVVAGYSNDSESKQLLQDLSVNPQARPPFSLQSGVLCHSGRVWIGDNPVLQ